MEISGRPHEGWLTIIPLAVLVAFVVSAMGGLSTFASTIAAWVRDALNVVLGWLNSL